MLQALEIATLLLVAAAWAFALGHAAEFPGKMRLDRDSYFIVQRIYYPGFTIGGASEPLAIIALTALLLLGPEGRNAVLVGIALAGTVATQAVYWLVTHPVNRRWVGGQASAELDMGTVGKTFFEMGGKQGGEWTELRDRWERSHLVRALLMTIVLVSLAMAVTR